MKTTTKIASTTILIGLMALLTPVLNVSAPRPTEPPMLEGTQFDILQLWEDGITEWELAADEPFYVIHGSVWTWNLLTPEEKRMVQDDSLTRFELSIDDNPQRLTKWLYFVRYEWMGEYYIGMYKLFYIQFDANEFEAGSQHIFEGCWYGYAGPPSGHAVTVTFT